MSFMSTARVNLAFVFHPSVRWEGLGSGFESSPVSGAGAGAGGVWKSRMCRKMSLQEFEQSVPDMSVIVHSLEYCRNFKTRPRHVIQKSEIFKKVALNPGSHGGNSIYMYDYSNKWCEALSPNTRKAKICEFSGPYDFSKFSRQNIKFEISFSSCLEFLQFFHSSLIF